MLGVSSCLVHVHAAQTRARHVRKRSEGSGFDTASRWTDISREEKGKWLIQEYGKVSFGVAVGLGTMFDFRLPSSLSPACGCFVRFRVFVP